MKTALITFFLILCQFMNGQNKVDLNLSFNHLALSVKDVNLSANFYKNILGLEEIINRTQMAGIRWLSLGEGKELHLISTLKDVVIINKAVHLALTTSHFEALVELLIANNIVYSDWPGTPNKVNIRADGIKQVFFQDVDGYWIEVNSVAQK